MKYQEFNQNIIDLVGGKENIQAVVHCMTRLRFTLKDRSKAQTEALKEMDGVIDVVSNKVAYQIIVGTHVNEVYKELVSMIGLNPEAQVDAPKEKKNFVKAALDVVSESMTPILEPIICAGLLAAVLSIVSLTGIISPESSTYIIFDTLRSAVFYFLPIFMAMSCAKRLGANPYLAVALAVTILSDSINGVSGLTMFGISLPEITYSNSFVPILLAVWVMGYVTKYVKKIVPNSLQLFLTPLLVMIVMLPATLLVFGPMGFYLGEGIIGVFNWLLNTVGSWFVMMLYSALQPFLIMLGAGNFIMPVVASLIASNGYDPAFITSCTISDIAVGGAMLGYFLRTKNNKQKQLFGTVTLSAILGITEPAIYGVFVKYRRPFVAVIIGGGLGGLFAGITGVKAYSVAWGLFGLPSYIGEGDFANLWFMVASVAISFLGAAVASYMLGVPAEDGAVESTVEPKQVVAEDTKINLRSIPLKSVVKGQLVQLSELEDKAFSTGALGKGVGIIPEANEIYSPVNGEVTVVFPTKHAIGIKGENNEEILIHIGIDTVELDGDGFEIAVAAGDKVMAGQKLGTVDFDRIKQAGYDPTTIVVVTNTNDYLDVIPEANKAVCDSDLAMNIIFE